jgi:AraC-like DNA-binding protein
MFWQCPKSLIDPRMNDEGSYSWSFDPLCPVDVRFYTYNKHTNLRLNRHDYFEVLYVSQGSIAFQIHRQNLNVKAGDLMIVGSSLFHRPIKYGSPPNKAIVLYFLPKAVMGVEGNGEDVEYLMPFLAQGAGFPHLLAAKTGVPAKVLNLIKLIYAELPAKSTRGRLNIKTYLKMILVLLGNHYADHRTEFIRFCRREESIRRLRPVLNFIDEHFPEPITVNDAASIAGMSKSHFTRFFADVIGQPFVAYLTHLRVTKAERLLAATDVPIAELSQQVGFCDQSYFGKVFHKSMGMSPARYRRQFTGVNFDQALKQNLVGGTSALLSPDSEKGSPRIYQKQSRRALVGRGEYIQ